MKKNYSQGQVKPIEKFSFMSFFFGQGLIYSLAGGSYLLYFLTDYALISPAVITVLLLVGKIWDAVNDTLFGLIVDRVRFKNNQKYKPWLWMAAFAVPILTVMMFAVSPKMSMTMRIVLFCVGYFLWDTAYTICDAPAFALVTSMTTDVKERISLTTFGNIGGVLAAGIFSIAIVPFFDKYGFFYASLLIAPISMILMIFLCIFAKERTHDKMQSYMASQLSDTLPVTESDIQSAEINAVAADPTLESVTPMNAAMSVQGDTLITPDAPVDKPATFMDSVRYVIHNKYMLLFYLYRIISGIFYIQFATYIAKHYFGDILVITYIMLVSIPLILSVYIFSGKLSRRFDKVTIYKFCMIASLILNLIIFFAAKNNKWIYVVGMAIMAALNILPAIFMTAIPGDCAEYGTYKTGSHNEGVTFSLQTFTAKITSAVSLALSSALLAVIGYSGELEVIPQVTLNWIWALGTIIPAAAQVIGLPILFLYKLKDKDAQIMSDYNHGKITREECDARLSRKY